MRLPKILLRITLNTLIGLLLIYIWNKFINLKSLIEILKTVNLKFSLLFFIFVVLSSVLRSLRLKILLNNNKISLKNLIALNFLSQFLSFLIPVRAGEITKSVYLSTEYKLNLTKTLTWIFLDRFFDFWIILVFVSILLTFNKTNLPTTFIQITALTFIIFTFFISLIIIKVSFFNKIVKILSNFLVYPKLKKFFLSLQQSIAEAILILKRKPKDLFILIFISILSTISDGLGWLIVLFATGVKISFLNALIGSMLTALTFLIPAAPGYVGSAEASGLVVFSGVLGVEPNLASAATIIAHILTTVILPLNGVISLYFLNFNLKIVWQKILRK